MEGSLKARKGGAYKLNLHPKAYFDGNPYKSDRGTVTVEYLLSCAKSAKFILQNCQKQAAPLESAAQ